MNNTFKIGKKTIGNNNPCFVIAEIGQAHDGSLGLAHSFIDAVAETGVDAIKFQTHIADQESTIDEPFRVKFSYEDKNRFDYWKRMEFSIDQWDGLKKHAHERGLIFLSSVFSLQAVDILNKIGVEAWKIGSGETNNTLLLSELIDSKKPILLSTGMSSWEEIDFSIDFINSKGSPLAVFQCTSAYPTDLENVGINVLTDMLKKYNFPIGLSDHSGTIFPSLLGMSRGANLLEVHVTFHKTMFGPDVPASLTLDELKLVKETRDAFYLMDNNKINKNNMANELEPMRKLFTKSVALNNKQPNGTVIEKSMLTTKKPGTGILAKDLELCIGKTLNVDKINGGILYWDDFK
jgi:N,N'-diacetyllegionaminate synthase